MRRFEFVGGTSSKFWEISRAGTEVTVTFGRIGSAGQTQVKDLGTETSAIGHVEKLIAEKLGKGYVERGDSAPSASPAVAVAANLPSPYPQQAISLGAVPAAQRSSSRPSRLARIWPWRRPEHSAAARALAAEVKRLASERYVGDSGAAMTTALAAVEVDDCRSAMLILLAEPSTLFPNDYWHRPLSSLLRSERVRQAAADPRVARACAEALIQISKRRPWGFRQAEALGQMITVAIEKVEDRDLPETVDALSALVGYINTIKDNRVGGLVLPPEPPPRFILVAVGALQKRHPGLAWRVVRELAEGPSSLAKVLTRLSSISISAEFIGDNADAVLQLVELASDLKGDPTKAWLERWERIREKAGPGIREALIELALRGEVTPDLTYGGSGTDIPRAAMVALSSWDDDETRAFLRQAILNWSRSGVGSPTVGTAAVWSLASYGDRAAVASMIDIRRRIRHKNLLKRLDREIAKLTEQLGVAADEIADESVDQCGLDKEGCRDWTMGDYKVELRLRPQGGIAKEVTRAGNAVKDVPARVRSERAGVWSEINATGKLLKETVSAQRERLELAMVDARTWDLEQWTRTFRSHPILWNLAKRLVWQIESDRTFLALPAGDAWSGQSGDIAVGQARLRIPHPVVMEPVDQAYWQHRIVDEEIVQPFKQVFRETYFVTPAEIAEGDRSHRFSGHVIPNQMMYALSKGRGWSGTMGLSGFDGSGEGFREFPTWGVRAAIVQAWGGNDAFNTIAEVSFMQRDLNGLWRPARIDEIPPVPFSEAMRDIDLVIAVASIGTDQQWLDWEIQREAGAVNWTDQRREYAGLAAAAAAVRGQLLKEMLPRLGLSDRAKVEGHFVHVRGKLGEYRVHLGSGNIHMEPSGRYLCIVPAPMKEDRAIYLPFEDPDLKSAEVLSKVLLLARDDKITDPVITRQLQ